MLQETSVAAQKLLRVAENTGGSSEQIDLMDLKADFNINDITTCDEIIDIRSFVSDLELGKFECVSLPMFAKQVRTDCDVICRL